MKIYIPHGRSVTAMALAFTLLCAACSSGSATSDSGASSPSCTTLSSYLVGDWVAASGSGGSGWRFPGHFSLDQAGFFRSGSLTLAWTVVYTPDGSGQEVCEGFSLIDGTGLPVITYNVQAAGTMLVVQNWNRSELYLRSDVGGGLPPCSVDSLTYSGDRPLADFDGVEYTGMDWINGERARPVLYRRGSQVAIGVEGTVANGDQQVSPPISARLRGSTAHGLSFEGDATIVGDHLSAQVMSDQALPNYVDFFGLSIDWSMDVAGTQLPCGTTTNDLYCSLEYSRDGTPRDTPALIACRGARGASTAVMALERLWAHEFEGLSTPTLDVAGRALSYYDPSTPTGGVGVQLSGSAYTMLVDPTVPSDPVVGTCGAWAGLMRLALEVHGISSTSLIMRPIEYAPSGVKPLLIPPCWEWCPDGSGLGYVYTLDLAGGTFAACGTPCNGSSSVYKGFNREGVAGQGNPNPAVTFHSHVVVEVDPALSTDVFDPSYGTRSLTRFEHERTHIAALADTDGMARRLKPNRTVPAISFVPFDVTTLP